DRVREATGGKGVDVILDCVGGRYLASNLKSLATGGALVIIGLIGGARAELDIAAMLTRRLRVIGSTLRTRSKTEKSEIVRAFLARFGADLSAGRVRPVIERAFPLDQAAEAHRMVESGAHFGKVVLKI